MKISCVFIFLFLLNTSYAQGIQFESDSTSWQTILDKAKKEKKLVFVDAVTSWCAPCKVMAKNVFPLQKVGDFFNANFINVKIDMEKNQNKVIGKTFSVEFYPTYLFISADNELLHKGSNLMAVDSFMALGKTAIDPNNQFNTLKKKFKNGNCSPEFLKRFSYMCSDAYEESLAIEVSSAYLQSQKDWFNKENMLFIKDFSTWIENPAYSFVLANKEQFKTEFGWRFIATLEDFLPASNTFRKFFDNKKREFDFTKAEAYLNKNLPKELADKTLKRIKIWQYEAQKDTVNLLKSTVAFFDNYTINDPRLFAKFASVFLEQAKEDAQLNKALEWSLNYVRIENNFDSYGLTASIFFKLKNKIKAKEYALAAIEKAKKEKEDYSDIEALLKKIDSLKP